MTAATGRLPFPLAFGAIAGSVIALVSLLAAPAGAQGIHIEPGDVLGNASVIGGETLLVGRWPIRLWGYDAPPKGLACRDEQRYDCGREAVERLRYFAHGRQLRCEVKARGALRAARCEALWVEMYGAHRVDTWRDVAFELIQEGSGVERASESNGFYAEASETAEAGKAGVWASTRWRGDAGAGTRRRP